MKVPEPGADSHQLIVPSVDVPADVGGSLEAFHAADGVFHDDAKGRDDAVPLFLLFRERVMFRSLLRHVHMRMISLVPEEARVRPDMHILRYKVQSAVLVGGFLVVQTPVFGWGEQEDATMLICPDHVLSRVPLLFAGVVLLLGFSFLRAPARTLCPIDEQILRLGELLEEFFHGADLALRKDEFPSKGLSEDREELLAPFLGTGAVHIEEESRDIKGGVHLEVEQDVEEFLLRRFLERSFTPASDLALAGLAVSFFVEQSLKSDQEIAEFRRCEAREGFHEARLLECALDLHRRWGTMEPMIPQELISDKSTIISIILKRYQEFGDG